MENEICSKLNPKFENFLFLQNSKKSRFLSKSYGSGERIRIRKDLSILTDLNPFWQKSTDPDPDPRNPDFHAIKSSIFKEMGDYFT